MVDHEVELVRRCLEGDAESVRTLVERYQGMVFGLCFRMLSHREDAEDVAQEALVRAIRHLHRWDATRPLKPWLLAIAANRCRTALLQRTRVPVPTEFVTETAQDVPSIEPRDFAEELQRALEHIKDDYRTCFILFHQQELSCAEIAGVMDCPVGTVKTWLHRARRDLADYLRRRGTVRETGNEPNRI